MAWEPLATAQLVPSRATETTQATPISGISSAASTSHAPYRRRHVEKPNIEGSRLRLPLPPQYAREVFDLPWLGTNLPCATIRRMTSPAADWLLLVAAKTQHSGCSESIQTGASSF